MRGLSVIRSVAFAGVSMVKFLPFPIAGFLFAKLFTSHAEFYTGLHIVFPDDQLA
ncbi:hypothetical protein SpAn4DRAFT_3008 [Sporomusa ovata]|uniref:Uncharacterized protein n=1 Tax=Sporomusa ovata TaxID=2378 RepID=A0A0U1KYQ4_9FIRM|nr:hypothetical protein SpAn4DRAFT_3008 [Sporomusa ovata]